MTDLRRWLPCIGGALALALILYLWLGISQARAARAASEAGRSQVEAQARVMEAAIHDKDEKLKSLEATVKRLKIKRFEETVKLPDGTTRTTVSEFTESEESSSKMVDSDRRTPDVKLPTLPPSALRSDRDYPLGIVALVDTSLGWAAGLSWELIEIRPPFLPVARLSLGLAAGQKLGGLQGFAIAGLRFGPRK